MELVIQLYLYNYQFEQDPYKRYFKQVRQREIDECFIRNIHHPLIHRVHILCETEEARSHFESIARDFNNMKCIFTLHGKQPSYADMVRYVATNIEAGKRVCIQNSDIYIDYSVSQEFLCKNSTPDRLIALTRHEHTDDGHEQCTVLTCPFVWDYMGSHDTFIFHTPIPSEFPYHTLEYPQNVYGGETLFMKAWKDSGKTLFNPCFDIRIFHRHQNRVTFATYPIVAEGDLCHSSPVAPSGRADIAASLKTMYTDE